MTDYDADEDFAACAAGPHWMVTVPVPAGVPRVAGTVNVWWRCIRCASERRDVLNASTLRNEGRNYRLSTEYKRFKRGASRSEWKATYLEQQGALSQREATLARRFLAARIQEARDLRERNK